MKNKGQMKLIDITRKFENKFENCRTNVGYIVNDIDYIYGQYIAEDLKNTKKDIKDNILYIVYNNNILDIDFIDILD